MGNIIDYLRWRGDLTFERDGFCEVDNLLLSYLSYVNLDGIAPGEGEGFLTLKEISGEFFRRYSQEELKKDRSFIRMAPYGMREMAKTERFGNIKVQNYVNRIEEKKNLQFSAVELVLSEEVSYLAFRGTDDRIVGWKEDFFLSNGIVGAQREALKYMNHIGRNCRHILTGGHSKGGNLSVYAAALCEKDIQDKVVQIYSNDAPGFSEEFLESEGFQRIFPRIQRYMTEGSIIETLLAHKKAPILIKSSAKGVMQHDCLSWETEGRNFIKCKEQNRAAAAFDEALKAWLDGINGEEREAFINDFFSVLEATGAETLTQLQEGGLKNLRLMLKQKNALKPETKKIIEKLIREFVNRWKMFLG